MSYICIYCRGVDKPAAREHVIPVALGTFGGKTPVLQCVCKECNERFSREFEQHVFRGGWEALQRFQYGLKSVEKKDEINSRRLKLHIKGSGELDGLRIDPVTNNVESQLKTRRRDTGEVVWLTLEEMRALSPKDADRLYEFGAMECRTIDKSHANLFLTELRRFGFAPVATDIVKSQMIPAGTQLKAEGTFACDVLNARVVTKIGLNCLAYYWGAEFMLHPQFDDARQLVLSGQWAENMRVQAVGMKAMAAQPRPENPYHLVLVHLQKNIVYARVALFTGFTYHITLSISASENTVPPEFLKGVGIAFLVKEKKVVPVRDKDLELFMKPAEGWLES